MSGVNKDDVPPVQAQIIPSSSSVPKSSILGQPLITHHDSQPV